MQQIVFCIGNAAGYKNVEKLINCTLHILIELIIKNSYIGNN